MFTNGINSKHPSTECKKSWMFWVSKVFCSIGRTSLILSSGNNIWINCSKETGAFVSTVWVPVRVVGDRLVQRWKSVFHGCSLGNEGWVFYAVPNPNCQQKLKVRVCFVPISGISAMNGLKLFNCFSSQNICFFSHNVQLLNKFVNFWIILQLVFSVERITRTFS